MATIVKYSDRLRSVNGYPCRIISPARPRACCATDMIQIGDQERDGTGLPYYYRRCRRCGFTVRHFLPCPAEGPPETIPEATGVLKLVAMASNRSDFD